MRAIDADVLKQHIDKLPALPDGNFAGNHSALKALINMQPTIEPPANNSEIPNSSDTISRQAAIDALCNYLVGKNVPCDGTLTCRLIENEVIKKLPSAQPEIGKWKNIVDGIEYTWGTCDSCGARIPMPYKYYRFCPNCGMKNEVTE